MNNFSKTKTDVDKLTLDHFLGADNQIDISFHECKDLQAAYDKLKPYVSLGSIEKRSSNNGLVWLQIKNDDKGISITAFL